MSKKFYVITEHEVSEKSGSGFWTWVILLTIAGVIMTILK